MSVCDTFLNRPIGSYRPLACKPIVVQTRELRGTGAANKRDLFFLTKPNTMREHATIDLLFPTPDFVRQATTPDLTLVDNARITSDAKVRVIDTALIRVVNQ